MSDNGDDKLITLSEFTLGKAPDDGNPEEALKWIVHAANAYGHMIAESIHALDGNQFAFVAVTHYLAGRAAGIYLAETGDDLAEQHGLNATYRLGLKDGYEAYRQDRANGATAETKQ